MSNDDKPVKVYWCKCGASIECVARPDLMSHSSKLEFTNAAKWGRKVETMTMKEFKTKPFLTCKCDTK